MDRLTTTVKIPPEGVFKVYSEAERKELKSIGDISEKEIYRRLQAYEDTGLTPEEIAVLVADNKRLHELVDIIEGAIRKR